MKQKVEKMIEVLEKKARPDNIHAHVHDHMHITVDEVKAARLEYDGIDLLRFQKMNWDCVCCREIFKEGMKDC